jgi:hypothetical protein
MADRHLKFYNKQGNPLNFEYVGATAGVPLTYTFNYETLSSNTTPGAGRISLISLSSNVIYLNVLDLNGFNISQWANEVNNKIQRGGKITLKLSIQPANLIQAVISSTSISSGIVTVNISGYTGPTAISNGNISYCETISQDLPGGYFKGSIFFEPVSAGLYENEQIFVLQEFRDSSTNQAFIGFPHTGATGSTGSPLWRSRWETDSYGDVDVSNVIFTYKITENDPELNGDPTITNYQNIVFPVISYPSDSYSNGYVSTPEASTPSRALQIDVAVNAPDQGAEVYERKLIIEDITSGTPSKVAEIDFYTQIVGSDERLDVLTRNLGRAFVNSDSQILRNHDPSEPLPDYIEINEKRKELMVAGEEIFPYIGSYKGLIGALKFFGYQDLRIKEYWLNLNYQRVNLTPLQENQLFLDRYNNTKTPNQTVLIEDVLDNENTGKYRLEQTYGPNSSGEYVLDVSSENTLVPSRTYKKTSLFGLYYDINTTSSEVDPYGYPETPEAFAFTQEDILVKLFALKQRLKESYLPLNARIVDITGEGVYYNIYNTKAWTDTLERDEIDSGNNIDFISNPDFGFLEDLRAFGIRTDQFSIQAPMNYNNIVDVGVEAIGPSGDAFRFSTSTSFNPSISIQRGKKYNFSLTATNYDYDLYFTTDPGLSQIDPVGVTNNGATGGTVVFDVDPQATGPYYYYSTVNSSKMSGIVNVISSPVSDLGNLVEPLHNQQRYTAAENLSIIESIGNFYDLKMNGNIKDLGENLNTNSYLTAENCNVPVGMPVVMELQLDTWDWDEMSMSWDSLTLPTFTNQNGALTWRTIDFSAYNEIEWVINKSQNQVGSGYNFSHRGYAIDFYKLAHFLPYTGEYDVTCYLYDSFNFKNRKIVKSSVTVSPKSIQIDGWTRYRENEKYTWDLTIRDWDSYDSIWQYPAEGKTQDELKKEIPEQLLDFAIYGNNSIDGQIFKVGKNVESVGASGYIQINQDILDISKIYSLLISGSQYGFANVFTTQPHNFDDGADVFITGSIDDLNKSWKISIPPGSTGYSFQIPYILGNQAGVGATSGPSSIAGGTGYYVLNSSYPNQKVTGGGSISVLINDRVIGSTASGSNLQASANSIIKEINAVQTQPDYFAQTFAPTEIPVSINIVADADSGNIGNGDKLTVLLSGSLNLVSADSSLSGGVTGGFRYVDWDASSGTNPVESLKYFGTKNLKWKSFTDSSWDNAYAHSWDDFEYENGWLGGYEIHSAKVGDNVKISTGSETFPFPVGVTFGGTGASAYLTLGSAASQLNASTDPNITNFYYRVIPENATATLTTNGPASVSIFPFAATGGTGSTPATVPGAPPPLVVSFTVATGP